MQGLGQIPMEQCYEGSDSGSKKRIDIACVEGNSGLVDGVIAAAKRDHTRPGD